MNHTSVSALSASCEAHSHEFFMVRGLPDYLRHAWLP